MRQANILDKIHAELSPLVFDKAEHPRPRLKPHHRQWLMKTIMKTLKEGGYEGMEKWLSLVFTGSLTTYQYSDESDVDISLFVDAKNFPDWSRAEMIGLMVDKMDGVTLPGTPHPMQCFVVPPGITRSDLYRKGMRSGYDLDTDEWIVPPERERVHDVQAEMNAQYVHALQQADKMEKLLQFEPDKAIMLWHQIHRRRRRDMGKGKGDYSDSNITYKMLANRGIFPKISEVSGEYIAHVGAELHIGLELPKDVAKQIHNWVKDQDWPEGTELEDPSDYHITLVYAPDGHEDHAEDEWRHAEKGYDAEITGLDLFGDEEQKAVVLKVRSPDVVRHAEDVMDVAEDRGLEISKFPGGYKPHITIAYAPGKPKGSPLKLKFKTGPSSVSEPREKIAFMPVQPLPEFDIASEAYQAAVNSGGITIRLDGVIPTVGYAFSPFKGQEKIVPVAALTEEDIDAYVTEHKQQLADPQNHLGIWVDGLNAYIDVTQVLTDFDAAYKIAWDAEQEAMWDIVQQKEIPVRRGGSSPLEIASHFGHGASQLAVKLAAKRPLPQVAKFVYNVPNHHMVIGDMAREEGEVESHYDLVRRAELPFQNNIYGQFSPDGRAVTFGRPRIEGFGGKGMNQYEAQYRAKQALEATVPGTKLDSFEPTHKKWEMVAPPKVTYMKNPPVLGDGPIAPEEKPEDEWKFSMAAEWHPHPERVEEARERVGLKLPVRFMPKREGRGGYAGISRDPMTGGPSHLILVGMGQHPGARNWAAWHELAHAHQTERGDLFQPTVNLSDEEYAKLPKEHEAEALAAKHADLDLWT